MKYYEKYKYKTKYFSERKRTWFSNKKANKVRLSQSEFIRKLIKDYTYETKSKIDYETMTTIIKSSIKDLTEVNNYMHRLRYEKIIIVLDRVINNLDKLID